MIKFFRKIRQQLVSQNRVSKYLLYAVGEIVLVVIGILIALQVNNWNVKRVNCKIETQLLVHLEREYQENYDELIKRREIRYRIMNSANWLLKAKDNNQLLQSIDSVDYHLAMTLIVPTFDPIRGVTDEIINSGKLQLIQNANLRVALTTWLSVTGDLMGEEKQYADFIYKQYSNYLVKNYNVRSLVTILQNDNKIDDFLEFKRPEFRIGENNSSNDIEKLATSREFENYLSWIMGWNNLLSSVTVNLISTSEKTLELIDQQ